MSQKKYSSQKTRSLHTYQFFKDRRNDPAWQEDFLHVKAIRRRNFILKTNLSIIILLIALIVYHQNRTNIMALTEYLNRSSSFAPSTSKVSSSHEISKHDSHRSQEPVVISNYSRYNNYSGNYKGSVESYYLDFEKGTLTSTGAQKQQIYYFDKVILHPDDSLVINVHGNYHYNAYDGKGEQQKLMYLSILLAPANKQIQKNWQTGATIKDETDTSKNRLAFASSDDNGKTFNMGTAYNVFEDNLITPKEGKSSLALLYSSTN